MTGEALAMRLQLARLAQRHKLAVAPITTIPLSAPVDGPQIVEGFANTTDVDLERTRFRSYAFCNPCLLLKDYRLPPLLYKHDESQPAGTIEALSYDGTGNLKIRATVEHELAKRCGAFSIRAQINAFEMRDVDSASFHALVTSAEIVEISLTDAPANVHALVQHRYPQPAAVAFWDSARRAVICMQEKVAALRVINAAPPITAPAPLASARQPLRRAPARITRRQTEFGVLVDHLKARTNGSQS